MKSIGVCSNKPRPSVQNNRDQSGFKTGQCAWGKDTWHFKSENGKTLCGIDCTEFLVIGEMEPDWHLCNRCRKKYQKGTTHDTE